MPHTIPNRSRPLALDPEIQQILERTSSVYHTDLESLPEADALAIARPVMPAFPPAPGTEDRTIPASDGTPLRIRLYGTKPTGARPILLHLHGGGFVAGSIELDDARCSWLAKETDCVVASLDYRLAPENRFPTATEDAFIAWSYLQNNAASFGGDGQSMAVSGSSAGGHIAIGVSLLAYRRGGSRPKFQILTYPVIDPDLASQSYRDFADGPFLTHARMAWYWKQYTPADIADEAMWNPMRTDAAEMPPTLVLTAEYDVLRDEGEAFAARLSDAGVPTRVHRHAGMIHGFIAVLPSHQETKAALHEAARFMAEGFG